MSKHKQLQWLAATILPLAVPGVFAQQATVLPEVEVLGTAEQAWKQRPACPPSRRKTSRSCPPTT